MQGVAGRAAVAAGGRVCVAAGRQRRDGAGGRRGGSRGGGARAGRGRGHAAAESQPAARPARARARRAALPACGRRDARRRRGEPPPPSLPYKVDTSRPSLRTNWTRLVPFPHRLWEAPRPASVGLCRPRAAPPAPPARARAPCCHGRAPRLPQRQEVNVKLPMDHDP